jgi:carbamoyl-phosphate synthase/aspartate carbamoyltransferase
MISIKNISKTFISNLFSKADNVHKLKLGNPLENKVLINAFFEPSTRTSLSFETAMYRLGGNVLTFNKDVSSMNKGENFEDTIKTLATFGDAIVLRHPEIGKVEAASNMCNIPIINGGDGAGEHPTQALLDLYTIYTKFPTLQGLKILFIGDLKYSRAVHSLIDILGFYPGNKIYFFPYKDRELDYETTCKISISHLQNIEDMTVYEENFDISEYDVVYCTRLQNERNVHALRDPGFILTKEIVNDMKEGAIIMHPLPRNQEISTEVDKDHRCMYFKQMEYGVKVRMALLHTILGSNGYQD